MLHASGFRTLAALGFPPWSFPSDGTLGGWSGGGEFSPSAKLASNDDSRLTLYAL